ncbi:dienelactone hydrolase [Herbaspirillum sp. meg3]|uniref:dienelactone hydrolase family protein n=1 Tax=Herbaspirillum sp. meg3 TaxID=2025949 RepID=UPI000B989F6F|nr:dienelactone hydrolase family protein [Herbaspirillum sp. meg3]ASU39912.1 dienelactone hydrolase [Herbaspirillum sp. meg3]
MSVIFNPAPIAAKFGIPVADLGMERIEYELEGVSYENVLLFDKKLTAPMAGVIAVPNFFGISQNALEIAAATIGAKQALLVADVFGKTARPTNPDEAVAAITPLLSDRAQLRKRMQAVQEVFKRQTKVKLTDKLAACGFCFGGTAALELARSGASLNAFASLHGTLDSPTPADAQNIKGAVLVLSGAQDPLVPLEQVNAFIAEMSATNADWQLINYGEAGHSFTDPYSNNPGFFYHERTAKRAAIALQSFFVEKLS